MAANCLSQPFGTAEVRYGINGVCHQTANRILLPTRLLVSTARGYNVSLSMFGHYGRKWQPGWAAWARRLAACMFPPASSQAADYVGVDRQMVLGKDVVMTDDARGPSYGTGVDDLLRFMDGDVSGTAEQVRQMCNPHLEQPLAPEEEKALASIQDWFEEQQKACVATLQAGEMTRERYLEAVNALLAESMTRYSKVLGQKRFLCVFGEAGYETERLIDKAIFLGDE